MVCFADKVILMKRKNEPTLKGGNPIMMSEALKQQIAVKLGVSNIVSSKGWGAVSSKDCGNIVREAIKIAESKLS